MIDFSRFDLLLRQLSEIQRLTFKNWENTRDFMQNFNFLNLSENFEQAINLQENLIKNNLDFQEQFYQFSIDMQKQFWDAYFKMMRRDQ